MRRMFWLDNQKNEILKLYKNNYTQKEIANIFNVSQTAISTRLRKWKTSNPDGNRFKRINLNKRTLYELYWEKEMHPSQIAKIYNCAKMVVYNRMIEYGIPRRTKSEARVGKLNSNWKNGACSERELFYTSSEWKIISSKVWFRDRKTCQKCQKMYNYGLIPFHIHHIVPFVNSKELRLEINNLILLCEECHRWVHSNKNINKLFLREI